VQAKCSVGLVYELLDDFREALLALSAVDADTVDPSIISDLRSMFQFLRTQAAVIARRPLLVLQQVRGLLHSLKMLLVGAPNITK
jgi:hypothetical protein